MRRTFSTLTTLLILNLAALDSADACIKDTDCKGDRICTDSKCQAPHDPTSQGQVRANESPPPIPLPSAVDGSTEAHAAADGTASSEPIKKTGLVFALDVGVNGCTGDWYGQYGPSAQLKIFTMYRIVPFFAAGLQLGFFFRSVDNPYVEMPWALVVAPELRGILPLSKFTQKVDLDIWISLSPGYSREMASGHVEKTGAKISSWSEGFVLGWGAGLDYFFTSFFGLGLNLKMYRSWYGSVCLDAGSTKCQDLNQASKDAIGIVWAVGAGFTFFIPI